MKEFFRLVGKADTASARWFLAVLEMETESQKSQKLTTTFESTDDSVLSQMRTERIRQILRAPTAVQTCAASYAREA